MTLEENKVRRVKALTQAAIKSKRIRNTPINRATVEVMLELADDKLEVEISETELSMLVGVYVDLKRQGPFKGLRELIIEDAGVRAFWAGVKNVVSTPDGPLRKKGWLTAYNTWELGAIENVWWQSPWGRGLLSFVRREKMQIYGFLLMDTTNPPRMMQ